MKFPGNLLTVPDMGRLQWSQIIRIWFSSSWKDAHQRGRAAISLNTSHATRHRAERNANILNDPNEMEIRAGLQRQVEDLEQVKMKGRSDARSE